MSYSEKKRSFYIPAALLLSAIFSIGFMAGCSELSDTQASTDSGLTESSSDSILNTQKNVDGWYKLMDKTVAGKDISSTFLYNCMELKEGIVKAYEVDYSGRKETTGSYTQDEENINIVFGLRTYNYIFDKESGSMNYSGKINKQTVSLTYAKEENFTLPETIGGVAFTDELFGESTEENFYNYCPTVMMEGNNIMHVWYCSNKNSGQVTDYIAYRKGILNDSGKWEFTEKQLLLSPTENTWDCVHTCDPSVVKGNFTMNGEKYSYLMSYLGCKTYDCTCNEVGIALAKNPEGPYVKVDSLNPIANFYSSKDYDDSSWGYGQPSMISSDNQGKVLLFYTKGVKSGTYVYVEEWDLSDMSSARIIRQGRLYDKGVTNSSGQTDCINNADFAYDPFRKRLYCIKEDFNYPTDGGVTWIAGSNTLLYLELGDSGFDLLFSSHSWNVCDTITSQKTGYFRNHNMGILTNEYGAIENPFEIPVLYTISEAATDYPDWEAKGQWPALHTYRLHGYIFEIK